MFDFMGGTTLERPKKIVAVLNETVSEVFITVTELDDEHEPLHRISGSKSGGISVSKSLLGVRCYRCSRETLNQREQSVGHILLIEAGRIHGVPEPSPPDEKEHQRVMHETVDVIVLAQRHTDLRDCCNKDQIEEKSSQETRLAS